MNKTVSMVVLVLLVFVHAACGARVVLESDSASDDGGGGQTGGSDTASSASSSGGAESMLDPNAVLKISGYVDQDPESFTVHFDEDDVYMGFALFTADAGDVMLTSIRLTWQGVGSYTDITSVRLYDPWYGEDFSQGVQAVDEDGTVTLSIHLRIPQGEARAVGFLVDFDGTVGATHSLTIASVEDVTTENGTVYGELPLEEPIVMLANCQPEIIFQPLDNSDAAYPAGTQDAFLWRGRLEARCTDLEIQALSFQILSIGHAPEEVSCDAPCSSPGDWNFENLRLVNPYNEATYMGPIAPGFILGQARLDFVNSFTLDANSAIELELRADISNPLHHDVDGVEYVVYHNYVTAQNETGEPAFMTVEYGSDFLFDTHFSLTE